jgi:hypothetical protein
MPLVTAVLLVFAVVSISCALLLLVAMTRHWRERRATLLPLVETADLLLIAALALGGLASAEYEREALYAIVAAIVINAWVLRYLMKHHGG